MQLWSAESLGGFHNLHVFNFCSAVCKKIYMLHHVGVVKQTSAQDLNCGGRLAGIAGRDPARSCAKLTVTVWSVEKMEKSEKLKSNFHGQSKNFESSEFARWFMVMRTDRCLPCFDGKWSSPFLLNGVLSPGLRNDHLRLSEFPNYAMPRICLV